VEYDALYLWVLLNLADFMTTKVALQRGARELNPLFRFIYKRFGLFMMWVVKFLLVALLPFTVYTLSALHGRPIDLEYTLWIWNAVLGLVVANNSFQLYRISRR
jgi:hypothetical protein